MQPRSNRTTRLFRAMFWMTCLAIGALSLTPVDHLPPQMFDIWDKAQHASGFAVLALLGQRAHPRALIALSIGLLGYGGSIELAQSATGWRHGDIWDWLADAIGIAIGLALSVPWRKRYMRTHPDAQ